MGLENKIRFSDENGADRVKPAFRGCLSDDLTAEEKATLQRARAEGRISDPCPRTGFDESYLKPLDEDELEIDQTLEQSEKINDD